MKSNWQELVAYEIPLSLEEISEEIESNKSEIGHITYELKHGKKTSNIVQERKEARIETLIEEISSLNELTIKTERKIVVLCGPPDIGKSSLEEKLIEERYGEIHKLPQLTTRKQKTLSDNKYLFIEDHTFETLIQKDALIGVAYDSSAKYGTIPDFKNNCINTVILSHRGLQHLFDSMADGDLIATVVVLGITNSSKDYDDGEILAFSNYIYDMDANEDSSLPSINGIMELLREIRFI